MPFFFRSAGARETVMRRCGNSKPELRMAALTRSRASCTAVSGKPTIVKAGRPGAMSTSTSTMEPSNPTTAQLRVRASVISIPPLKRASLSKAENARSV